MPEFILVTPPAEGVMTITLNRPEKRNALSTALRDEVSDALDAAADDEQVKVIVLTGAGEIFSAGFDLKEFENSDPDFQRVLWESSDRFHRTVLECPVPIIAAVNGPALAGGFDLAVLCDIRLASSTARFAHPEQSWSDVVYGPLHDLVGGAVARDLTMTGRPIDAGEALRLHLVSVVVPPDQFQAEADRWAAMVARAPRDALRRTKGKAVARAHVSGPTLNL